MFEMINTIQTAPFVTLGLLVIGVALGLIAGIFVLPAAGRARRLQAEIEALRGDHDRYQRSVTDHFQTTAVLVGDLTSSYKAVYEHLASGARTLSDPALTSHGFGAPRLIVDGAEQDRLPQDPIAHDTDPMSEPNPVEAPASQEPGGEASADEAGGGAVSEGLPEASGIGGPETSAPTAAGDETTPAAGDETTTAFADGGGADRPGPGAAPQ